MEKEDIPSADSYFSHPRRIFYTIKRCPHHITPQNSPSPLATGAFSANGIKKPCRLCYKTGRDRMLTKSTDWQSVEKARKQGNFASGKICRRRRLDLTIPKGSANPPQGSKLASKGAYIDVSDRRMQVQLTRKFCLRQNLSPRATGFVDPEGLGKSTCRKQKSPLISILSERFLRLWALSALWGWHGTPCHPQKQTTDKPLRSGTNAGVK